MDYTSMKNLEKTPNKGTKPFGTLYHHTMGKTKGSVVITPRKRSAKDTLTRTVGAGLTSVAMALYIYSFGSLTQSQILPSNGADTQVGKVTEASAASNEITFSEMKKNDTSFSIYIPYLKTKSDIFVSVDPFNEQEYSDALSKGVAQAKGTGLPGQGERIFLFAHSTNSILNIQKYNALFYDLSKVPNGETIDIYYNGKIYQYRTTGQKIVSATDVSWLEPKDGEELILQTCYPPGTSWKRLLLFASPV